MRLLLSIILYLVGVIQAAPTTNTTTTTSDGSDASSFSNRSLWSIISSCALTLFACIYSATHPNIPSPEDSLVLILRRRLGIMLMALIAPELIVTWAMRQWISACHVTKQFEESEYFNVRHKQERSENNERAAEQLEFEDHDSTQLLVAHAEASTSGGTRGLVKKLVKAYVSNQSEDYAWTQTHSFFLLMGGFMLYVDGEPYHTLQPDLLLKLIRDGRVDAPTLTAKRIRDKSKGNVISKGLIILQVAWFVLQLISRAIYRLETTLLETGTLAFAVLNFLTYAVWWNKPLDVQCPHPVYWKSTESKPKDYIEDVSSTPDFPSYGVLIPVLRPLGELAGDRRIPTSRILRVPIFDGSIDLGELGDSVVLVLAGLLIATIFGGIHCIAWFFSFPTYQERVLWRISAVAITCTPWLGFLVAIIWMVLELDNVEIVTVILCTILYIPARAILLVLMVTTLRNLPPDAYEAVSWTSLIPHL